MVNIRSDFVPTAKTLDGIEVLRDMPPSMIESTTANCRWIEVSENEVVVDMNEMSSEVYFIVSGRLRALSYLPTGKGVRLSDLTTGQCFGELAALDGEPRSAQVIALEPCLLASLTSPQFHALLQDCPLVALTLLRRLAQLVRTLNVRMKETAMRTPQQRIFADLLRLARPDHDNPESWIITAAPTHMDLAAWVGTDQSMVAETIGALTRDGVVVRHHKDLVIKDRARLRWLTGERFSASPH